MKKFLKLLAMVVAMTLFVGVIPSIAAEKAMSLTKTSKTIYVGGCKGYKETGSKAPYYSYITASKYINNYDEKTMKITLTSEDPSIAKVNNKKGRITAVAIGVTNVKFEVFDIATNTLKFSKDMKVTVKQNATEETLVVKGIEDGDELIAGQTVTVSLPRTTGTDTDARRLVCDDDGVTIKSAGTRKWKVTFVEPGDYILYAEAYQSATYAKATVTKAIEVFVEESPEPTKAPTKAPTATPVPTKAPAATATPVPTTAPVATATPTPSTPVATATPVPVVPTKLSVQQVTATSFKLSGPTITANTKAGDIKFIIMYGSFESEQPLSSAKEFKAEAGSVTVNLFTKFEKGREYRFQVGGETVTLIGSGTELSDVVRMEIATQEVRYGVDSEIKMKYYNASGVDITSECGANDLVNIEIVNDVNNAAYSYGRMINFTQKDKAVTVKATLSTGINPTTYEQITITAMGSIRSYVPVVVSCIYTLTDVNDTKYLKATDNLNHRIAVGDYMSLEALFTFSDGSVKNFSDAGITSLEFGRRASLNEIAYVDEQLPTGGYKIYAFAEGADNILLKSGDDVVYSIPITVVSARRPSGITITPSKNVLNINGSVGDKVILTAKVTDQYSQPYVGAYITADQTDASRNSITGFSGSFLDNNDGTYTCTVNGSSLSILGTATTASLPILCTCEGQTRQVNISLKNVSMVSTDAANGYYATLSPRTGTVDKGASSYLSDKDPSVKVKLTITDGSGYFLSNTATITTTVPATARNAASYGMTVGTTQFFMTIEKTGSGSTSTAYYDASSLPAGIEITDDSEIKFSPYSSSGTALADGTYKVVVYRVKGQASNSIVKVMDTAVISVKTVTPSTSCVLIATDAIDNWDSNFGHYFKFSVNGVELDVSSSNTNVSLVTGDETKTQWHELGDGRVLVQKLTYSLTKSGVPGSAQVTFSGISKTIFVP